MSEYTEEVIKGKMPTKMLPEGYALVLEGGGTRGYYSAGVFEAFMDEGIMFPYVIGVSAGAANAMSYLSGQQMRGRQLVEKYVNSHKYLGYFNLIKEGSLFGYDYVFNTIPNRHVFWDKEIFERNKARLLVGATDVNSGEPVWFEKDDYKDDITPVVASCSIPIVSKIVKYKGYELLDGGISSPIPIDKSIEDGNIFHVVVLTRNAGYRKAAVTQKRLLKSMYKNYPNFVETMLARHEIYERQVEICEQLEKEGKAIIIRPQQPIQVGRATKNVRKLLKLYDEGHEEGNQAVKQLRKVLAKGKK